MAIFPKIQSPCPIKNQVANFMDGDTCRMCKRQVFDLTDMSDAQRVAFVRGCEGEVCVSYRLPLRIAAAAVAMAALAAPMAAAAADANAPTPTEISGMEMGGIHDPGNAEFVSHPTDVAETATPELPVVYDDQAAAKTPAPAAQTPDANAAPAKP